jgi:sugar lactone lactonase YvrE
MVRHSAYSILVAGGLLAAHPIFAAGVDGQVLDDVGAPLTGAMITLIRADGLYSETVYSDNAGRFRLDTALDGDLTLRARAPRFGDAQQVVHLLATGTAKADFKLRRLTSPDELSYALTGSAQFKRLKFKSEQQRKDFQNDCLSCHQIGNERTRKAAPVEYWQATVQRMLGYVGSSNPETLAEYVELLSKAFDGKPYIVEQSTDVAPEMLRAKITEWKLPGAIIAHDGEVNPKDGRFYLVDGDAVFITDPVANRTETVPVPAMGVPLGGNFPAMGLPIPIGMNQSRHGMHSLQYGPDGRFYITSALGGTITSYDPASREFKDYPVGGGALWPHTLRFDRKGIAWFTISISNQVGRFDPASGQTKVIDLPKTTNRPSAGFMFPYGIDVSPVDGSVWYTRLWAGKIGRVDPNTLAVKEFDPPLSGPRRLRFDASGTLWIPAFGDGALVKLDTKTMKYTTYKMPRLSPDESEAPYALAVDPRRQDVWITSNMSDRLFRFVPKEGRFIPYRLPTRGTYTREFFFPPDGRICSPASPLPAAPDVIEGGTDTIVCVDIGK